MIKEYKGEYNRKEFYSIMGQFFAEPLYKRILPYLKNDDDYIWLINKRGSKVVAFTAYKVGENKIDFAVDFYRNKIEDLQVLTEQKLKDLKGSSKTIETATADPLIYKMFVGMGFVEVKKTANYKFLVLEQEVKND